METYTQKELLEKMTDGELSSIKMVEEKYSYTYALRHNPRGFEDSALLDYILNAARYEEEKMFLGLKDSIQQHNHGVRPLFIDRMQNVSKRNIWKEKMLMTCQPTGYYLVRKNTTNNETYRIPFYNNFGHIEQIMMEDIMQNKTGAFSASYKKLPSGVIFGQTDFTFREAMTLPELSLSDFIGKMLIVLDTVYLQEEMFGEIDETLVLANDNKEKYFCHESNILNNPLEGSTVTFDIYMKATFSQGTNAGLKLARYQLLREKWMKKYGEIGDRA